MTAIATGLFASLAMLVATSPALAEEHHPKGDFEQFADCPLSNHATNLCIFAQTESGKFIIGKKTVPISSTLTLQGGVHLVENEEEEIERYEFIGAENGPTLSNSPQSVPGGLLGVVAPEFLPKFLQNIINKLVSEGLAGVTATTELAEPATSIYINPSNLIERTGNTLSLPIKVKLNNTFLGESCYIGSDAHPIMLPLTTGKTAPPKPNEPIEGKVGSVKLKDGDNLTVITENTLVNNSFAAPKAEGCGGLLSFLIDTAVDAEIGLPAAAGENTAILEGKLKDANAPAVTASE